MEGFLELLRLLASLVKHWNRTQERGARQGRIGKLILMGSFDVRQGVRVTLHVTPHWNSEPHFPMTRVHSKTLTAHPFYP